MGWSPRELGELADTSRRTVRHYQEIGLLPEPERQSNGYRQYGVAHLLQLLRIRRLARLGLPLPQIAAVERGEEQLASALGDLEVELAEKADQLQRTRGELAAMLARAEPDDLLSEITTDPAEMPMAERALLVVLGRVLERAALEAYVDLLRPYRESPAVIEFDSLSVNVGEGARASLAAGIAQHLCHISLEQPDQIHRINGDLRTGPVHRRHTINRAVSDLYNDAQLDVLARARRLSTGEPIVIRAVDPSGR